ncbi:TetR/AcrR family transcriptional regulator [Spongiactinospora sp. TRM90649]|uniref:TetR/AcrR family transcriptional regulator n=1 Tax=Spongiactinospora sp. TRM90649 TaxID=3031114 RepID=UPI0023F6E28A|nr:TetR/AcrR family transcriptional regulator [Spongiactinospora sp. TRM90649]MDF5756536.1 TetR/AcrR family transcriptional regulator [Spongiactinospora sp. TRM90649]
MAVYAGQGDARRSMDLLWRRPAPAAPRPGPKPRLSVEVIVAAAIEVADEEGMAALSMRAVGERLGRTGMALYTYVPSKGELVDLMCDKVMGEQPAGYDLSGGWRAALSAWAGDSLDFHVRHPWLLAVSQARPILGPGEFASLQTVAEIVRASGLAPAEARGVVSALFGLVREAARTIAEARQAPAVTGTGDEEWWRARSALLAEAAPDFAGRFPAAVWLESGPRQAPPADGTPYLEHQARAGFASALAVLLDGVSAAAARGG